MKKHTDKEISDDKRKDKKKNDDKKPKGDNPFKNALKSVKK